MSNRLILSFMLLPLFLLVACNDFKAWYATEFRQGDVTSGIVRLSAQHLSVITSELAKKFKNVEVTTNIIAAKDPQEVGKGTVVKTLSNIDLDFPTEATVFEDCLGTKAFWKGSIHVINATQSIYGRLTNNRENPVIPDPNGVKMVIKVRADHSKIKFSDKPDYVQFDKGEISFDAYPRLAQAQEGVLKGLRVIPTSNTRFENVSLKDVSGTLFSKVVTLPFDIAESNYLIQIGVGENGDENRLDGEVTAFGNKRRIPNDGNLLNPAYQKSDFMMSYSCKEGLLGKVEFNNVLFEEKLAPGMAGLTTLAMSKIASKLADDHVCGMASVPFLRNTALSANPMELGTSRGSLLGPCTIKFENYRTQPDCFGVAHEINGEASVIYATKIMSGLIFLSADDFSNSIDAFEQDLQAGDIVAALTRKPEPVLPKSRQPASIELTADLSGLVVTEVCVHLGSVDHKDHCSNQKDNNSPMVFGLLAGRVSAKLRPLMGKNIDPADDRYQMCSERSVPIAEVELELKSVNASIRKSNNEFQLIADGVYRAISGKIDDHENELSGEVKIGSVPVPFRAVDKDYLPLLPDYDSERFKDSYQSCMQHKFIVPASDNDCSLVELGL